MKNRIIKFKNKINDHIVYQSPDGKTKEEIWKSRSVAVDSFVFAMGDGVGTMVLIIKRSKKMRDEPNKFAVPSGYLDWNENGYDAMIRELYEETSLYLPDYNEFIEFDNSKQPFFTLSNPSVNRQNVVLLYITVLNFKNQLNNFPWFIETYKNRETAEVKWITYYDFIKAKRDWAFNHDQKIINALSYYESGRFDIKSFYESI